MTREAVKLSEEAVKLSALGAKNLAALCLAMAKDNRKLTGKTKLKRLLTEGKELRVFDLKEEDVSAFAKEAKTYGILFSMIRNTKADRDTVDVIVKAEDAARINRIFENMGYAVPERAKKEMSRTLQENKSSGLGTGLTKADMRSERESVVGKIKTYQKLLQNQKKSKKKGMGREISMKKIFITAILTAIYACTTVYAAYYPVSIDESTKNGVRTITKSYELNQNDDVTAISKEGFEQNGSFFIFRDMVKTELPQAESKEYAEKVVISSKSNKMNDILPLLEEEKQVVTEDGFSGTAKLDLSNLKIESAGYGTSTKNVSITRTYPNLDSADTQYIPKTTVENGKTLELSGIHWQSGNTQNINDTAVTDRYTAVATYTGTVSNSYVKGYTVTAEYKGTVSKTNTDKVLYTAIFEESTPMEKNKANALYAVLPLGGVLAGIAGTILLGKLKKRKGVEDEEESNDVDIDTADDDDDNYPGIGTGV